MKHIIVMSIMFVISFLSIQGYANEKNERAYLIQMFNQLESLKPLVVAASKEQPNNLRIMFHYTAYKDTANVLHNGLLEDINEIEKGIKDKLNQISIEPHRFTIIKGDYNGDAK